MKSSIFLATTSVALAFGAMAYAKDISDLKIGEVTCIDVFGPWNKIGTIVDMNYSNKEVLVRDSDGKQKWHPAEKTRSAFSCKVTKEAADWLVQKGIETAVSN